MANKVINRGDACVDDGFTDDQRADVFTAAVGGEFSCAADGAGGKVLSGAGCQRGPGCQECTDRAEFAPGGACHEEVLMREQRFSGPWLEVWTLTILAQKDAFCGTECSW